MSSDKILFYFTYCPVFFFRKIPFLTLASKASKKRIVTLICQSLFYLALIQTKYKIWFIFWVCLRKGIVNPVRVADSDMTLYIIVSILSMSEMFNLLELVNKGLNRLN